MQSKTGSILLLISGILNLVFTLFLLVFFFLFAIVSEDRVPIGFYIVLFTILSILCLASGLLKLYSAHLMKDSKRVKNGGILGLVLGILTFDVLAIIGGILGIIDSGK